MIGNNYGVLKRRPTGSNRLDLVDELDSLVFSPREAVEHAARDAGSGTYVVYVLSSPRGGAWMFEAEVATETVTTVNIK